MKYLSTLLFLILMVCSTAAYAGSTQTMYNEIKDAREQGVFLGMTSQCLDGSVRMTVYDSGRDLLDLGIIPLENMISETALVKAMWSLGNSSNIEEMQALMLKNIASEF